MAFLCCRSLQGSAFKYTSAVRHAAFIPTYYFYFQNWDDATGTEIIRNPDAHINNKPVTSWDWGYNGYYTYILTQPGSDPGKIESQIRKIAVDYTKQITQNDGKDGVSSSTCYKHSFKLKSGT